MPKAPADSILQYLRTILGGRACKGMQDQDLVCQFVSARDQAAFAEKFDDVQPFSDGLAAVASGKLWGYIDKTGKWTIKPKFKSAYGFAGGFAPVVVQ